jgi:hypothetical protein
MFDDIYSHTFLQNPLMIRCTFCLRNDRLNPGRQWPITPGVGVDNLAVRAAPTSSHLLEESNSTIVEKKKGTHITTNKT